MTASVSDLPTTWLSLKLGDVVAYGKTEKAEPEDIAPETWVLELEDLEKDTTKVLQRLTFTERQSKSTKNKFNAGDVLYGKLRPYLNKVTFADRPGVCTTEIVPIKPNEAVHGRYLFHWLRHPAFLTYVTEVSHGVNMPRLGTDAGRDAPFVLAPKDEQKRIADKLDTVLIRVDAVNTRLARVAPLLKRFRQSVLAAATSGRLTEDWRQEQSSFKKGQEIEWSDTTLRTCISTMSGGASPSVDDYSAEGVLALNKGDIKLYGHLASKKNQNRVPEIYATQHNNKIVRTGELLVTLRDLSSKADFLGLIAQYINAEVALPTQGMYKLNVNPNTNRKYLMYFSNSPAYREIMKREKVGATQVHLRNDQFLDIPIALPPMEEQTEIVRRVETLFAFADRIEARLAQAQTAATRLTPALLAKAFRGELVPQDPNDEPAAELMRRLAEKPATPAKRGRTAKVI